MNSNLTLFQPHSVRDVFETPLKLFDEVFGPPMLTSSPLLNGSSLAAVDITEDDDNLYVSAQVPGFTREQIKVTYQDQILTISAEYAEKKESEENTRTYVKEIRHGRVARRLNLPSAIDATAASSRLENGILHLTLPKMAESATTIDIKVGEEQIGEQKTKAIKS